MDSIISLVQKNTLAEYMILSGADNLPPMLDKDMYDSWKSRMELYMKNREHERMILESVEHGPLIWPTVEENGVIRTKKYAELSAVEKIQADCDMKATNIILQVLPTDIYSLVNHHRVAKDLWERVQLLMQGTSLTKQERECKLYDAFDKFTHIKGESLHTYYLRFTQLINDMNIYKINMEQFQVNTKFLNSLPPEWNSGFAVLVFSSGDDPIACLNKAMEFLTLVASCRVTVQQVQGRQGRNYSGTTYKGNATSSKGNTTSRQAKTEDLDTYDSDYDDLSNAQTVLMANVSNYGSHVISEVPNSENYLNDMDNQSVHALQDFEQSLVMDFTDNEIPSDSNIIPYSQYLQETQHATVQDTNLQAPQDSMILSVIEQMSEQMINHVNNWEKANKEHNQESITAELERYKERVKTFKQRLNIDLSCREKMIDSQMDDMIKEKLSLKEKVDLLEQNLSKQITKKKCLLETFNVFKNKSKEKENKYMETEIDLELKIKELNNIVFKVGQSAQTVHMLTKPQSFYDNVYKQAPDTLILKEQSRSKMSEKAKDPEVIAKKISHKPIGYEKLNRLIDDFGKCFTPQQELLTEQAFWLRISNPTIESSLPPVRVEVSELPKRRESCEKCLNLDAESSISKQAYNDLLNRNVQARFRTLALKLMHNRESYIFYIKHTHDQADILRGVKCSTSASGSKPSGNTKYKRISQPSSSNKINKVEDQPTSVKARKNNKNHVKKVNCDDHVMQSISNANSISVSINNAPVKNYVNDVKSEPNHTWGSIATDIPSSSSLVMIGCPDCTLHQRLRAGYGTDDYLISTLREKVYLSDSRRLLKIYMGKIFEDKDEAPAAIIKCIKNIQVRLNAIVRNVRTDNGTEFVNQTLREFYENVGISHQTSVARTPQQNGVVERRNQTLVEAAPTMLIFSKALLFLWPEAINTACYT
uniref:Integrase, catalytic region, zinc finger, CCHC-type, peptidase aspartic, catalytic n=1 Tax=Tanacetum cinerariifolium TaxID=118510 RepID=A0A6L2KA22_TANCI|nr:integrase, catalytic region, zinc finger, CCHC-type, peptidase aspartic, catalytic [Tanacetum cinerariifolium]